MYQALKLEARTADPLYVTVFDSSKFISIRAYRIFFDEVRRHIGQAQTTLLEFENMSPDDMKRLACAFHTIRGGAGFFGLDQLSKVAGTLEETFGHSPAEVIEQRADVIARISELAKIAAELPEPPVESS